MGLVTPTRGLFIEHIFSQVIALAETDGPREHFLSSIVWHIKLKPGHNLPDIENLGEFFVTNPWWRTAVIISTEVYKQGANGFLLLELELADRSSRTWLRIERRAVEKKSLISSILSLGTTAAEDDVSGHPFPLYSLTNATTAD